jgi:urocanate hydratase
MHGTKIMLLLLALTAGTYNGITSAEINGTYTTISNVTLDSFDITTSGTATATGDVGGVTVTATQNRLFDLACLNLIYIDSTRHNS